MRACASASSGAYVANNGYDFDLATKVLEASAADLIAFGKPFISNPDLVERLKKGAAAERVGQGDVLRRRRQGIHGLSDAGRGAGGGVRALAVIPSCPAKAQARNRVGPS